MKPEESKSLQGSSERKVVIVKIKDAAGVQKDAGARGLESEIEMTSKCDTDNGHETGGGTPSANVKGGNLSPTKEMQTQQQSSLSLPTGKSGGRSGVPLLPSPM